VGFAAAAVAHFAGSSAAVFTVTEHLASTSGIVVIASQIGGTAFASCVRYDECEPSII
jgi:hypothetical protein